MTLQDLLDIVLLMNEDIVALFLDVHSQEAHLIVLRELLRGARLPLLPDDLLERLSHSRLRRGQDVIHVDRDQPHQLLTRLRRLQHPPEVRFRHALLQVVDESVHLPFQDLQLAVSMI